MKIIQINISSNGSTGRIALAIHKRLLSDGHESYFFYGNGPQIECSNCHKIGNKLSVHLHAFLSRWTGLQGYYSFFSTKKLLRTISKIKPDIIHLHNLHGSYLNLPLFFKYLNKNSIPTLITLHDCWLFTGKCPHFVNIGCTKWKSQCLKCPQLNIYPRSLFFDRTNKMFHDKQKWLISSGSCKYIYSVSDWLMNTAKQSFLGCFDIKRIYNGIPTDTFHYIKDSTSLFEHKFVILGVASSWGIRKGLDAFVALSKKLADDEMIVLVGLDDEQISNLPNNITGIKRTDSINELVKLYSRADVLINFSTEETFGLVVAEAMACGTPVIVFDSTACGEIVDNKSGYVIPVSEKSNIYEYIQKVKNRVFDKLYIENRAKFLFSETRMVDNYLNEYKSLQNKQQ